MKGILPLLIANLKKRKAQSIITIIIIAVSAIMFTTAATVATSLKQPFDEMYRALNASQLLILNQNGIYDTKEVADWWGKQQGVTVQTFKYHYTNDRLMYKGNTLNEGLLFFAEKPDTDLKQDKLAVLEGETGLCPLPGEIWICRSFADKRGISIGDNLDVSTMDGYKPYKVTAVVADAQFGSPSMGVLRLWVGPAELGRMFDSASGSGDFIGLRFDDYSKKDVLWKAFENELGKAFNADIFDYDLISSAYTMQFVIMGAILNVFAIILLIIASCIISFTISAAVTSDVKTIGILKSQGYTPGAVTWLYALQYIALSVIAVPVGVFLSTFVAEGTTGIMTSSMGVTSIQLSMLVPGLTSFAVIILFVSLVSFCTARKAGRMKPIAAMREENAGVKSVKAIGRGKTAFMPVPLQVAIRQIFTQKWQSLLLVLGSIALSAVFTFSVNLFNSFDRMNEVSDQWGFDRRDDTISFGEGSDPAFRKNFENLLKNDKRVSKYIAIAQYDFPVRIEGRDGSYKDVMMQVYDGDITDVGGITVEGTNPTEENEIEISVNASKKFGVRTGDYITVDIAGSKMELLVSGINQSMVRMGWGAKAQLALLKRVVPNFSLQSYAVIYRSPSDRESFIKEYNGKYPGQLVIQSYADTLNGFMYGTKVGINSFILFLGTVFTLVMLIVIFSSTLIGVYREKRVYGILKSIGLTPVQVRMTIVWKTLILTIVGVMIGIPLACFGELPLLNMMLVQMGIVRFPFVTTLAGMAAVAPVCLFIGFISSWIPSRKIHNISARDLVIE